MNQRLPLSSLFAHALLGGLSRTRLLVPGLLLATLLMGACDFGVVPRPYPHWDRQGDGGPLDELDEDAGETGTDAGETGTDAGEPGTDAGETGTDAGETGTDAGETGTDAGDPDPPEGGVEMRGVWITRFAFSSQASLEGIIERAAAANFNAVFVQVRGAGDAYYDSNHEPWAQGLAGALGRDPGWDPLAVAVAKGHSLGLEVHAYVNALSALAVAHSPVAMAEGPHQHALYTNPEWAAVTQSGVNQDAEYFYFAPTPEVAAHTAAVVTDILERYDVDGIHLDRIRMPGPNYSYDAVSQALYAQAQTSRPNLTYGQFMQEQVSAVVEAIFDAVIDTRPEVTLSAAVWGIYERFPGCTTSQGRADYHQDSVGWIEDGIMDVLVPMMYWPDAADPCTNFRALTERFVNESAPNPLWAGVHALEIRENYTWQPNKLMGRLNTALEVGAQGSVIFASTYFDNGTGSWDVFVGNPSNPGIWADPIDAPGPMR